MDLKGELREEYLVNLRIEYLRSQAYEIHEVASVNSESAK